MLIVSQNLRRYRMRFPAKTIYRVNLAWVNSTADLKVLLDPISAPVLLDIPTGRIKPPRNSFSFHSLTQVIDTYKNIQYLAISNVESGRHLRPYVKIDPHLTVIPKIETKKGIENIRTIIQALGPGKRIIMLDHDDLFSSLIRERIHPNAFPRYVERLVCYCRDHKIILLRSRGVIFSD